MTAPTLTGAYESALARATAVVATLAPHELEELAAGRATLAYRPVVAERPRPELRAHRTRRREPARRALGIDIPGVVERINTLPSATEVAAYLDGLDGRFTVPVLREIARAIGPTVTATGRTKAQLQRDIVEGTAGFRERTAAMSGGAWS